MGTQPMEIKPPWSSEHNQYVRVFPWRALGVQRTYNVVVGAADWGGAARALASTDDVDRGAVGADEGVQGGDNNPEKVEESGEGASSIGLRYLSQPRLV